MAGVGLRYLPMLLKEAHLRLQMSFFFSSWHHFGLLLMLATWKSRISFLANHSITLSFLTWELVHYGSKKKKNHRIIRKEEMCRFSSTFHSGRALYESCFMLRQHFHSQRILRASPCLITASHMGNASKGPCYGLPPGAPNPKTGLGCLQPGEGGYSCF